jgi:predicted transcriptional regulator of viral defense system
MKFELLVARMRQRPYFRLEDLHPGGHIEAHEPVQLSHWAREGKIIRLKKGLYTLAPALRRSELSTLELSEPMYRPSYISLEWALSRYGLIPEAVGTLTSVTTLKTARFQNDFGVFDYHNVKPAYFFGFTRETVPALHFLATPEKALLDFFHLSIPKSQPITTELLRDGYRLQNLDRLRKTYLKRALSRFSTPKVLQGESALRKLLEKNID